VIVSESSEAVSSGAKRMSKRHRRPGGAMVRSGSALSLVRPQTVPDHEEETLEYKGTSISHNDDKRRQTTT
jgi:hypothetical protein